MDEADDAGLRGRLAELDAENARLRDALAWAGGDENRYRAMFGSAVDFAIIATDVDGRVTEWNTGAVRLLGWSAEEMRGRTAVRFFTPEDRQAERPREEMRQALEAGRAGDERWHLRRDGARFWASGEMMPLRGPDGALLGYLKILRDRTAEHEAGVARRRSEAFLRLILDSSVNGLCGLDRDGVVTFCNAAASRMLGLAREQEAVGLRLHDLIGSSGPDGGPITEAAKAGKPGHVRDATFFRADGTRLPVECWIHPIRPGDADAGAVCTFLDITERRKAEDSLIVETRALETLNRTGVVISSELDLEHVVQVVTDAGRTLTGAAFGAFFYNVATQAGESYMLYTISGVDRSEFDKFPMPRNTAIFSSTFSGIGIVRSDDILVDPRYGRNAPHAGMPGGHLPVRSYLAVPVVSRSGEVLGALLFGHPEPGRFTERHEYLLVAIAAHAAIAIDNSQLYQAAQRELVDRRRAEEQLRELNETLETRIAEEIAERAKAEAALRQSQKMEAVGQLTGGLAHDFNNLLTGITGSLELLQTRVAQGRIDEVDRYVNAAQGAARRAAALTHRLLAFSRRQTLDPRPTDVNRLVAGMQELIERTIGPGIALEPVAEDGLWTTLIDPSQLENALLNLCINARDAMPDGGRLTVETGNRWLDGRAARERELPAGAYVTLCVSDNGTGMPPDVIARAFDPFFTTKPIGQGTGLGLSMIYGFVRQSGGQVRIHSEPGRGTTVCLYLPRQSGEADATEIEVLPGVAPRAGQGETVLVVDDEPTVRMLVAEVLEDLGYCTIEAADGAAGLQVLNSAVRVDLLVTDVGLPGGMNGRQLADAARVARPALKVLFITGYAENAVLSHGHLEPGMHVLTKPFAMEALAGRIRELIAGSRDADPVGASHLPA